MFIIRMTMSSIHSPSQDPQLFNMSPACFPQAVILRMRNSIFQHAFIYRVKTEHQEPALTILLLKSEIQILCSQHDMLQISGVRGRLEVPVISIAEYTYLSLVFLSAQRSQFHIQKENHKQATARFGGAVNPHEE